MLMKTDKYVMHLLNRRVIIIFSVRGIKHLRGDGFVFGIVFFPFITFDLKFWGH